jgi:xylulokinase
LEFSTQSAKAVALGTESGSVVATYQLSYDDSFPKYGTHGGVLPSDDPTIRHTSPTMLVEGIDELFRRMVSDGLDLSRVAAVKLDAQQHSTVYTDESFPDRLGTLDAGSPLAGQVSAALTRPTAPIWEDRSTEREARLLENRLSGQGGIQKLTANRAELRFPASQILKWGLEDTATYDRTAHIQLLSAYLTSVLAGRLAPVDTGDGWGTNLNNTDIENPEWEDTVLAVFDDELRTAGAATGLREKLGEMDHYDAPVGPIAPYFARAYGVNPEATVLAGTGDNPATLLGCGGNLVISLGSSYTVNGMLAQVGDHTGAEYNVFGYVPGRAMALSVITNGTKVHDAFRKKYASGGTWQEYGELAGPREVTAEEPLLLPYLQDESVPLKRAGVVREGFEEEASQTNVRALHLAQALSLRLHSAHVSDPQSLTVVGGGSQNEALRAFITDAFGAPTFRIRNGDLAAPLGCAIAAARYALGIDYADAARRFVQVEEGSWMGPQSGVERTYADLLERYAELERTV